MGLEDQHALSGAGMFVPGPITFEAEYSNQGKVTEAGAPSGPLTRSLRKATLHQSSVRRLTPTECERLMSWPDGWTAVDGDKTPDSRRYAACGNGVVSNVAEWIGRRIMAVEREG
jgi:site-specific DNA-cytosine methylase